jgi:hypothetical protein
MYGGEDRCIQDFGGEIDHLENSGIRWEDNIKMGFQEVGCRDMDCIYLAQGRDG